MQSHELSGVNPQDRGAVTFKNFIEYAERNGVLPAEAPTLTSGETNDFEDAVRMVLLDRGFQVDAQVGVSRYRIDLAVRDRCDPSRYLLGIECDGATYHSSRTARDRDLLRQDVLRGMGWRLHRVWSTEWFHERERAIQSMLRRIEQAEAAPADEPIPARADEKPEPTAGTEPLDQGARRRRGAGPTEVSERHAISEVSQCIHGRSREATPIEE